MAVEGEAYIQKDNYRDYTYPLSYIATLPSAAIVKQMEGDGGMINMLKMDFGNVDMIPITDEKGPVVKLERARQRTSFNKIITEIVNGVVTYYRGLAIVNPVASFRNPAKYPQNNYLMDSSFRIVKKHLLSYHPSCGPVSRTPWVVPIIPLYQTKIHTK